MTDIFNKSSLKFARDWAGAAFGGLDSTPQMEMECRSQGWGPPMHGKSITGKPLCIGDRVFSFGIGTHADSEIVLKLPSGGKRFCAFAGMDKNNDSMKWHAARTQDKSIQETGNPLSATVIREYPCYRLAPEPVIDGKLNGEVWNTIPPCRTIYLNSTLFAV